MPTTDLFAPAAPIERLNPNFRALREQRGYTPARTLLTRIWADFVDKDGNFLEQFQTTGFDARTWELFLFALLWDLGVEFDWTQQRPDFVVSYNGMHFCIEAVTANPTQAGDVVIDEYPNDAARIEHEVQELYPIRLGSALYSKLCKRYWELSHVQDRPLILAIEDFHEPGSLYSCGASLWQYLYGFRGTWSVDATGTLNVQQVPVTEHRDGSKRIPSGFFELPDAQHISAILFGNSGTVTKFNRLGYLLGYGREHILKMIRVGFQYDHEPNQANPKKFTYEVGSPAAPNEGWEQGLSLYHNPHALHPVPLGFLPFAYHYLDNGKMRSFLPDFHPYASQTITLVLRPDS